MARFKKLTKKERHIIYEAMELVAHDPYMGACGAIRCRDSKDTLEYAYRYVFASNPFTYYMVFEELSENLTIKNIQQWRLTMLAWFAEIGRLEE